MEALKHQIFILIFFSSVSPIVNIAAFPFYSPSLGTEKCTDTRPMVVCAEKTLCQNVRYFMR